MNVFCHVNRIFDEGTKLLMEAFCEVSFSKENEMRESVGM
jgi:hypothetical protein